MKIVMKTNNTIGFNEALKDVRKSLVGETIGNEWIYKTDKGAYTFYNGLIGQGYVQFEGKRTSFGTSSYFRVRRVKSLIGKDKIKMLIGKKEFTMQVTVFESSAKDKPFWVNCSKEDYRALQKLKAR